MHDEQINLISTRKGRSKVLAKVSHSSEPNTTEGSSTKKAPSYIAIKKSFESSDERIKRYYSDLPKLIDGNFSYQICIAYCFLKVEQALNRTLYGGVAKVHRGDKDIAQRIVNMHHLTRDGFLNLYRNIFGRPLNDDVLNKIKAAEKIRDKVIHGKRVTDPEIREAIIDVLEYSQSLNIEVHSIAGFYPFGDMRGFKGRSKPLDRRTTKWLMRGLGFGAKA